MLLDPVELAAPPGLWPQLGRPLLRTGDQIVSDIVLCVADFFGSMPRNLRLDRISPRVVYRRLATSVTFGRKVALTGVCGGGGGGQGRICSGLMKK